MSDPDCIFCRIVSGDVPADVVHSTDEIVAFRDINPQAPVHVQVIPRRHITDASALGAGDGELLVRMVLAAQHVAASEGISERGYRLVFNVGEDAANTIPHLHLHVLGGRRLGWPPG
ncbi:MAG TPA: histidine triad nucleotide-binding protein [Acidimicrobiales bacterium]|nr:histidine triad nucleotide-binding protein [Acidimicrobiales bacterium]